MHCCNAANAEFVCTCSPTCPGAQGGVDDQSAEIDRDGYESDEAGAAPVSAASQAAAAAAAELEIDPEVRRMRRAQRVAEVKVRLASAATAVLENPEENIQRLEDFSDCFLDSDPIVRQLAILSATEVYKDVIPGYRIRLPSQSEANVKVCNSMRLALCVHAHLQSSAMWLNVYMNMT